MNRFVLVVTILLFSACTFFTEKTEIIIVLPDSGPAVPIESWRLIYPETCSGGIPSFAETIIPVGTRDHLIQIARGNNLPILAYPVFGLGSERSFFGGFPAAAVFPLDITDGGRLCLNDESGVPAELLRCCAQNSPVYRGLDSGRLRAVIMGKAAEDAGGDPWMIDQESILCRLGYGLFRDSAVKIAETMDFEIPVSGGNYFSDNPFQQASDILPGGMLQVRVPVNRKTAFYSEGGNEVVLVYFNDTFWCWSNSATGAGESGRR